MIEEEDDEDILKKKITLKSVLKNLLSVFLIILGGLFIYTGILPDAVSGWSIGFMLICLGATLIQMQKKATDPIRQTLTILICRLCGLTKVRNYEKGDFVFRRIDKCDKCDDMMEVKQIYSVRLKKPTETNRAAESKKKVIKTEVKQQGFNSIRGFSNS